MRQFDMLVYKYEKQASDLTELYLDRNTSYNRQKK